MRSIEFFFVHSVLELRSALASRCNLLGTSSYVCMFTDNIKRSSQRKLTNVSLTIRLNYNHRNRYCGLVLLPTVHLWYFSCLML